jgi:GntR family transcriptional regulator/MocR family aminotransferase
VRVVGGAAVPVPVDGEGLDVAAGIARAPSARAVLLAPSHQYPLGVTLGLTRRMALLRWAASSGAVVIEDDYDSEFRHRGRPLMALQGLDEAGRVVYVGTFSKTLFPGLRLGFFVVPPALVDPVRATRAALAAPAPLLEQAAVAEFIAEGHFARHLRRMRVAYRERGEALLAALRSECAGVLDPHPCDTGMQLSADLAPDLSDRRVGEAALARGVEVGALSDYGLGHRSLQGLVFGFGCARPPALRTAVIELARAIDGLPR